MKRLNLSQLVSFFGLILCFQYTLHSQIYTSPNLNQQAYSEDELILQIHPQDEQYQYAYTLIFKNKKS